MSVKRSQLFLSDSFSGAQELSGETVLNSTIILILIPCNVVENDTNCFRCWTAYCRLKLYTGVPGSAL